MWPLRQRSLDLSEGLPSDFFYDFPQVELCSFDIFLYILLSDYVQKYMTNKGI